MSNRIRIAACLTSIVLALPAVAAGHEPAPTLDLAAAVVVAPPNLDAAGRKAVAVLCEEVEKRTGIRLKVRTHWPTTMVPVIAVGLLSQAKEFAGPYVATLDSMKGHGSPEAYLLSVERRPRDTVLLAAADSRGLLYAVGCLLRKMELKPQVARVPVGLRSRTAPHFPIRGHQLGYRPKVNTFDAWSVAQFDQYIRELALFGANSIEILPPRTDDHKTSPLMKLPPMEMMERLAEVIDSYGLDVWIWYPNMGKDYRDEATVRAELAEREDIFRRLKRIDHIFVPGGDPGNVPPDELFPWLGRVATVLHKYHPKAKIWVSPQGFLETGRRRVDLFCRLANEKPAWLGGVVHGPWVPLTLPELRAALVPEIKIRNYPDITHNVVCQYPVPNWDLAFALTLHRECINPRPEAMKTIHNAFASSTCGSLCYSEGINDDVNKFVWLDQDWDPGLPVLTTLHDYARLFVHPDFADDMAQGLLALERNWVGPLAVNGQVDTTLQQWRDLEERVPQATRDNYRFQMGLLRAHYDAYVKRRLIYETALEGRARDVLRTESNRGAVAAMEKAETVLDRARSEPVAVDLKQKCEVLADALFKNIGAQLTVKKHGGQHRTRGAFMDGIDEPLNDAAWLRAQFRRIRALADEAARQQALAQMLDRTNPGPGGFYDALGAFSSERRIADRLPWPEDPGSLKSPRTDYPYNLELPQHRDVPLAWRRQKLALYETPLRLTYYDLDPTATYRLRVTYAGEFTRPTSLVANDSHVIHREVDKTPTHEFPIPREATAKGGLELVWRGGGVSEVWLMRQPTESMSEGR